MKHLLYLAISFLFLASCGQNNKTKFTGQPGDKSRIDSLETEMMKAMEKQENPQIPLALNAIKRYTYYAADYPKDSLSPGYLFKAAQIYEGVLQDKPKAAEIYGKVYDNYPKYKNRPMMLFHQGNTYIEMNDTLNAGRKLRKFIADYPNHEFADDAVGLMNLMRMNDAQMQQFFQNSQKKADKQPVSANKE